MLDPQGQLIAAHSDPYSASPSWHRNLRRRRARARLALRFADTPHRVNTAAQLIANHHGSQLPTMGKWWRCRQCGWHSQNHQNACGSCGHAYQQLVGTAARPSPAAPSGNWSAAGSSAHHKAAVKAPGHGRRRRGQSFAARKKSAARTNGPQDMETDPASADQTECHIEALKSEMSTLNHVISSLRGRSDDSASHIVSSAQERLKQLRVEVTRSKPLEVQARTLQELVGRRWEACPNASQAHQDAQVAL